MTHRGLLEPLLVIKGGNCKGGKQTSYIGRIEAKNGKKRLIQQSKGDKNRTASKRKKPQQTCWGISKLILLIITSNITWIINNLDIAKDAVLFNVNNKGGDVGFSGYLADFL